MAMKRALTKCNPDRSCRSATRPIPKMPHDLSGDSFAAPPTHRSGLGYLKRSADISCVGSAWDDWAASSTSARMDSRHQPSPTWQRPQRQHCLDWETRPRRRTQSKLHSLKDGSTLVFHPTHILAGGSGGIRPRLEHSWSFQATSG